MARRKQRWITKGKFRDLKKGNKVKVRYMVYPGFIAGKPHEKTIILEGEEPQLYDCIDVTFEQGPWKGKTVNLVRQQIASVY